MAVYVDPIFTMTPRTKQAQKHGDQWCHMTADTDEELHAMADKIKLWRRYAQSMDAPQQWRHHYDLTPPKRARAVKLGAIEVASLEETEVYKRTARITNARMVDVSLMPDGSLAMAVDRIEHEPPTLV